MRVVRLNTNTKCTICGADLKAKWQVYADYEDKVVCRYCARKVAVEAGNVALLLYELLGQNVYIHKTIASPVDIGPIPPESAPDEDLPF